MTEQYTDLDTIVKNIPEYESTKPDLNLKFSPTFETEIEMPDVVRVRNITPDMIKENWQVKEKGFLQNFGRGIWTDQGRQINDLINSNWTLPNATNESAKEMTDIIMRGKLLRDQHREFVDSNAGYSSDSFGRGLGNAVGSSIQYAIIGSLTGSVGIFGVGAVQAALQSDENWKKTYLQEHGTLDGYAPENQIYSVANGALQGWIEQKLGVENLLSGALREGSAGVAKWTAKKAVQGMLGESAEEFTQEITEYSFGKLAGQERRDSEQLAKDALAGAIYGGIVGGAMGSSMYYANRRNLSKALQKTGMSEELANTTAQKAIDAGTESTRREIITRAQLQDRFGDSYTGLIDKIDSALSFTGWQNNNLDKNQKEFATENADMIALQVINWADMNGIATNDALDLAKIDVIDNVVYLDQSAIGDVNTRIKEKKAQLKEQNKLAKTGAGDTNLRSILQKQIHILEKLKEKRDYELQNIQVSEKAQQAKKDIKALKKSKTATEFFANLSESDRLSLLNPDGSLNQNALQDRYENAMMVDLLDNDVMAYDTLSTQINGSKIVRALIKAMPSIDALSKTYPNRNIKKEIAKAILLSKGLTKANFTQRINNQPITGADAFITNALLYNFTFSDAQGISAFIDNYAQLARQNSENANTKDTFGNQVSPERLNSEIMADLLVKTYDVPNVKNPVFDENGVALQKEMRAVLLTQAAQPVIPKIFNQIDIKADINSKEFKKWFDDSKVVDENGKPLVVYHGTNAEFDTFKPQHGGMATWGKGYYFINNKITAQNYINGDGQIMPVYLSIKNPLYLEDKSSTIDEQLQKVGIKKFSHLDSQESQDKLKEQGYDGVIVHGAQTLLGGKLYIDTVYVAFEPNQIKSVNNQGTFSKETGNIYKQGKSANGYFDPELQVIVLGKNTNSGTIPHEMSHFWLEKMFNMSMKGQNITPELSNSMSQLFKILGVSEDQTKITTEQHEQFANMSEAYIFQLADLPDGTEYAFNRFMAFVPAKYENIMSIGYRDENGIIKHPLLDKMAIDWFNAWYGNGALPIISESPAGIKSLNSVDNAEKIIPSKEQVIKDRESELDNGFKETNARYADQQQQIDQGMPQSEKAEIGVAESKILANPDLIEQDLASLEQTTEKRRFNWLRRNTNIEQVQKAEEYKQKNKEHAYEIAFGDPQLVPNDTGINRAFLIKSVMNDFQVGSDADSILRYNYAQNASLSGSGLQAYRGDSMALYLESAKKLYTDIDKENAYKMFGKNKDALQAYDDAIQSLILQHADSILATKSNSDARNKAIDTLTKQAELQFGGQGDARLLKQLDLTGQKTTSRDVFINWANKELKRIIQTKAQRDRVNKLYSECEKARKAAIEIDSNDKATYTAAAKMLKAFNKFMHATDENTWVQKVFGNYAINAMLSNPSTHIVNIGSNTINYPVVLAAMKGQFKAQGVSNSVPRAKIQAQTDKLNTIYNSSYLNLATMDNLASESLMVGERYKLPDQENKSILNLPGRALSKADTWFRFPMFSEAAAMIASREAKATGRNSSEIFDEICSINNKKGKTSKTNRAAELRQEALMIANMATFTQDGTLEKSLNWMRRGLNKMTGDPNFGLGNLLAPFVKTPANIVEMGARALPATFYKAIGAAIDVKGRKAGKYDWNIKDTIGWSYLTIGVIASIAMASDYEPPYEPPQKYNPDKPYDSIKIGGVWIKLDAFGPFSIPMRMAASYQYGKTFRTGVLADTPLIGDIEYQSSLWQRAPGMAASKYAYGQINKLVPAILKPEIQYGFRSYDAELMGKDLDVGFKTGIARSMERQYGLDGRNMDFVDLIHELTIKKVKFDK